MSHRCMCVSVGMVKETGHAAEQFLRSVANGQADHQAERDQRAAAALQRVNTSPDWQTDCRSEFPPVPVFFLCHVRSEMAKWLRYHDTGGHI